MNISETINEVKKELNSDEQMLASAFKAEKLYKKHKMKLFTVLTLAVLYFGGTAVMDNIAQGKLETANKAYLTLSKDAKNTSALTELKSNNPALFELFSYNQAVKNKDINSLKILSKSHNPIIADVSNYHLNLLEKQETDSKFYDEIAKIYNASLLIKEGKVSEARDELDLIGEESVAYNISKMMKHYSIKGK